MLRKEREITSKEEIIDVLHRCDTLRIAFRGDEYPYVVPVSFGIKRDGDDVFLYFHGAKRGFKVEQIKKYPMVCAEGDIFIKTELTERGITVRYESVIVFGRVEEAEGDEIIEGLNLICGHYGYDGYLEENLGKLTMPAVYRIRVEKMTGKRNLPEK